MSECEAKDTEEREEGKRGKRVQPVHDELKQAAQPEDSQGKQALTEMSVAAQLSLAESSQVLGAQRAGAMFNLQQTYGNRYVQMLVEGSKQATLDEHVMRRIENQRGSGKPLEPGVRSQMESAFERTFGDVKIHTGVEADALSQQLKAKAFTTGKDIFFKEGAYQPHSDTGIKLIAHELTHVMQQTGSYPAQRQVSKETPVAPPAKNAKPSSEEALETAEAEEPEVSAEAIEPLPEIVGVSEDLAPKESQAAETGVMAAFAGLAPTPVSHQVLSPDHPSEREAEAISRTIMSSGEKGNRPRISYISSGVMNMIQLQLYWPRVLKWSDFKAKAPIGSQRNAVITTGFKTLKIPKEKKEAHPHVPLFPKLKHCKKGTPLMEASVGFDWRTISIQGYMLPAQSWVKSGKKSPALLDHEDGHFRIAALIARKIENAIQLWDLKLRTNSVACGKNAALNAATKKWNAARPNEVIRQIRRSGLELFRRINISTGEYDTDTEHGTNAAGQAAWKAKIDADLKDYTIPVPPVPRWP
jgi:hypothetical protein